MKKMLLVLAAVAAATLLQAIPVPDPRYRRTHPMPIPGLTIIGETINDSVPSTKKLFDAGDLQGLLDLAEKGVPDLFLGGGVPREGR